MSVKTKDSGSQERLASSQSSNGPTDDEIMAVYRQEYFATVGGVLKHMDSDQAVLATVRRFVTSARGDRKAIIGMVRYLTRDWYSEKDRISEALRVARAWALDAFNAGARSAPSAIGDTGPLKLDNERQVFFYEQDHYYLSNFSSFKINWWGRIFPTSEHAYQWSRFRDESVERIIRFALEHKQYQRPDWDVMKVDIMRDILRTKAKQHEYVRRKLLETGDRELIENSWRDPFWGWGPNRDGKNMLGRLWMEIRAELRSADSDSETKPLPSDASEEAR